MSEALAADHRLHRATIAIAIVRLAPQCVVIPAMGARFALELNAGATALFAIAGLFAAIGVAWLRWSRFGYAVADGQLVIEQGVFSRNRRTIPFDRIQDVSIEQKLLGRIFGVATVRVETGSGDSDEGMLDVIGIAEASRLRDTIRRHRAGEAIGTSGPSEAAAGGGETEAMYEAPVLFAMSIGRLFILGLFSFSFIFLAALGSIAQFALTYLPGNLTDPERYLRTELPGDSASRMMEYWVLTSSIGVASAFLVAGMIAGLAKTLALDFGFRLTRTETGLRRERGLFTRTDVVMPLRRVQAAIVSTGIVRKFFGWQALSLQSIGADTDKQMHHIVAPLARADELAPILAEIGLDPPPPRDRFTPISRRGLGVGIAATFVATLGALLAGAIIQRVADNAVGYLLVIVALLPLVGAALRRQSHRWHIKGSQIFVRKGVAKRGITILDRKRIQSVTLRRGPIQRLFGLATLVVGTAGAPRSSPLSIVDLDESAARRLMDGWMILPPPPDIANSPATP